MYIQSCLSRNQWCILRIDSDHIFYLFFYTLRLCAWKIDLVDNRHNVQIMIECQIYIRKCLCLNSLCRINNKNRSVAGRQTSGYLIVEIDVSRCINQVENILFSVICLIYSTDCLCFDRDSTLSLQIHVIENL